LILRFPGPASSTGEDLVEFHCHGGRAVVAAVEAALAAQPGLRHAEPGEFTRRALGNGRIDLMQAEGLADLLEAETEAQRVAAMAASEGRLSARVREWIDRVAILSARVEAMLDYAEEGDVTNDADMLATIRQAAADLGREIAQALAAPSVERLRAGVRVVIGGPPNAGKSTLLNALAEREAAIVSPIAGTTRDPIEASVQRRGLPLTLVDTAGLTVTRDIVEAIGVERARVAIDQADVLVWLGDDPPPRNDALWLHARADVPDRHQKPEGPTLAVSTNDASSIQAAWAAIAERADTLLTSVDGVPALHERQRRLCQQAVESLAEVSRDPLIIAEALASARRALARLLAIDPTDLMFDALFSRFCLGK
jgi:tRNA modification GTPase